MNTKRDFYKLIEHMFSGIPPCQKTCSTGTFNYGVGITGHENIAFGDRAYQSKSLAKGIGMLTICITISNQNERHRRLFSHMGKPFTFDKSHVSSTMLAHVVQEDRDFENCNDVTVIDKMRVGGRYNVTWDMIKAFENRTESEDNLMKIQSAHLYDGLVEFYGELIREINQYLKSSRSSP